MSLMLRVVLIVVSLFTMAFIMKRIRDSKIQIEDSLFWIIFSVLILILSIFPGLADALAGFFGIYSTVNFIFLFFIFVLIIKLFMMTVKVSQLESKLRELAQKYAIDKKGLKEKEKNNVNNK